MPGTTLTTETTTWFSTESRISTPRTTQYKLIGSYSLESAESPKQAVVDAVVDVTQPVGGQTTLTLYEHLDPDALDDLITASADKRSHVEIRFTFEEYLIIVRSTNTVLIYEPL
ncbi:hypothetical protein DMJ13_20040 [halophilic archaeon]|nr:hypothetical protein DMJ13_20040 [halophilic archaeon]